MPYRPNQIPPEKRAFHIATAVILITYGVISLAIDDMYLPRRRRRPGTHLHGAAVVLAFAAILCASGALLTVVVDHYDRRDNERHYRTAALALQVTALVLFVAAILVNDRSRRRTMYRPAAPAPPTAPP
jgi:hypothetical protein